MTKKYYINFFIIVILMIIVILSLPMSVYGAGAMDSNPNVQLPNGSQPDLKPGQENQKNQEKKEEKKKKEEIKKQTEWTDKEKKEMTSEQIMNYIKENYAIKDGVSQGDIGSINESQEVKEAWVETLRKDGYKADDDSTGGSILSQLEDRTYGVGTIYKSQPKKNDPTSSSASIDDMIDDADSFINKGTVTYKTNLSDISNVIYNILLTVGVLISVIIGAIIGVKLMVSSGVDKKAEAKQLLVPYVVGCVVVFGGFGIWKLLVQILQGL